MTDRMASPDALVVLRDGEGHLAWLCSTGAPYEVAAELVELGRRAGPEAVYAAEIVYEATCRDAVPIEYRWVGRLVRAIHHNAKAPLPHSSTRQPTDTEAHLDLIRRAIVLAARSEEHRDALLTLAARCKMLNISALGSYISTIERAHGC